MAALLASAVAGALVGASLAGQYALAAAIGVVQLLLLIGMTRSGDVPAARTSAAVALVAGVASALVVALTAEGAFDIESMTPALVAIGAGFVAMVIVQLARRDGRERLTASLTFGVWALLLVTALVGWLALGDDDTGAALLALALSGTAVGAAIMIFPGPAVIWVIGGTIGAGSVGLVLEAYLPAVDGADLGPLAAGVAAAVCGLAAAIGVWVSGLIRDDAPAGAARPGLAHGLVTATIPVALAAPVAVGTAWALAEGLLA